MEENKIFSDIDFVGLVLMNLLVICEIGLGIFCLHQMKKSYILSLKKIKLKDLLITIIMVGLLFLWQNYIENSGFYQKQPRSGNSSFTMIENNLVLYIWYYYRRLV
ncbi:hypothetical protein NC01_06965 [Streptococcus uberis]|nr:hypothetical protein NC01_06965 [Streptococcus uberis]